MAKNSERKQQIIDIVHFFGQKVDLWPVTIVTKTHE